jgi:hypothetical protein
VEEHRSGIRDEGAARTQEGEEEPGLDVSHVRIASGGEPYPLAQARGRRTAGKHHRHEHHAKEPPKKMPAETSPRTSSEAKIQHRTKRRRATHDQLAKHTEHLVPRQRLQEAHGTEAPPLPGPGDLGFSPGTLPGDGDPHDASREDHGARWRRRRRAGQASQGFRPVPQVGLIVWPNFFILFSPAVGTHREHFICLY